MRERVCRRLVVADPVQRRRDVDVVEDGDRARRDRGRALPARAAMHVAAHALVHPADDRADRVIEPVRGQMTEVDDAQPDLRDLVPGQRQLDLGALLLAVLGVLGEVQHASHTAGGERIDVPGIQRVGADDQLREHLGESVALKPIRHLAKPRWRPAPRAGAIGADILESMEQRADIFDLGEPADELRRGPPVRSRGGARRVRVGRRAVSDRARARPGPCSTSPAPPPTATRCGCGSRSRSPDRACAASATPRRRSRSTPVRSPSPAAARSSNRRMSAKTRRSCWSCATGRVTRWCWRSRALLLCRPDCLGLCTICGADLNEAGPDHGHEPAPDPRWAKLSELHLDG